jgi:putative ABC transport system ATP-binding protein
MGDMVKVGGNGQSGTLIAARNLAKTYRRGSEELHVLQGVNLDIDKGDFVAFMGPSGSGKTTLLNLIGGLDVPTSGTVTVAGDEISHLSGARLTKWRARHVGFVFQMYNLLPVLSAFRNVELPLLLTPLSKADRKKHVETALSLVGLADRGTHKPRELSGGQQQRVALARALMAKPAVLFADEPTGNLDSATGRDVLTLLRDAVDQHGQTLVMVTHDPVAASYADRVVFLRDGRLVGDLPDPTPPIVAERMTFLEQLS